MRHSRVSSPVKQEMKFEEQAAKTEALSGDGNVEDNLEYPMVMKNAAGAMFLTFPTNDSFLDCKECRTKYEGRCLKHEAQGYLRNAEAESNHGNSQAACVASEASKDDTVKASSPKEKGINKQHSFQDIKDVAHAKKSMELRRKAARKIAGGVSRMKERNAVFECDENMDYTLSPIQIKNGGQIQNGCDSTVDSDNCNGRLAEVVYVQTKGGDCNMDDAELSVDDSELQNNIGKDASICDVCGMELTGGGSRRRHKIVLTGDKPYRCDVCGLRFDCCSGMRTHKRIHTGERPYKCETCGTAFTRGTDLNIHRRIHTGEKPYRCEVCHVPFTCSGHLIAHRRVHTGEKPFICSVCGVAFSVSSTLRSHKLVHTGERPFRCDVCGFGFITGEGLKKHKRVHTGEKPYKCEHCPSQFTSASNLMRHSRVHSGLKPYKCEVCLVGFSCTSVLRKHERIHTGEKPYTCDICGMKFAASFTLAKHKKLHTGNNPYKCLVCGAGFTSVGNLTKHKRVHVEQRST